MPECQLQTVFDGSELVFNYLQSFFLSFQCFLLFMCTQGRPNSEYGFSMPVRNPGHNYCFGFFSSLVLKILITVSVMADQEEMQPKILKV